MSQHPPVRPASERAGSPSGRRTLHARSFSLLELLIVFSMLLVLAALLVPTIKSVKDAAATAACANNLRQIGLAIHMYGMDRRYYPLAYEANRNFTHRIEQYIDGKIGLSDADDNKRSRIFECPARTFKPTNVVNCYALHCRVVGDLILDGFFDPPDPGVFPRRYPFTERPAEVILASDADQRSNVDGGEAFPCLWNPLEFLMDYSAASANSPPSWGTGNNKDDTSFFFFGQMRFRHRFNTKAMCLMIDGHVEGLEQDEIKQRHIRISN